MRYAVAAVALLWLGAPPLSAGEDSFAARLHVKFQVKACTRCHDFFEPQRDGISGKSHEGRGPKSCVLCHTSKVSGFEHAEDWFARPGLYTSGMNAREACEAVKKSVHAEFKNPALTARDLRKHLLEDPRVLWAIAGATPESGALPQGKRQVELVPDGLKRWKEDVEAWLGGGLLCE